MLLDGREGGQRQSRPELTRSAAHLLEQAHVVPARPVLDDQPVGDAPDVDEPPRDATTHSDHRDVHVEVRIV